MGLFSKGPKGPVTYSGKRLPMMAGNWKMNKTMEEAIELVQQISYGIEPKYDQCEVVLCPPFTDIRSARVVLMTDGSPVRLAGQDVHPAESGAYTGCISAAMLKSLGCQYCIVGHSERREYFGETNDDVNAKIVALRRHDMYPIMCCGESLECRDAGETLDFVTTQVREGMAGMEPADVERSVIAYILIDNLDELSRHVQDFGSEVNDIAGILRDFAAELDGVLREYDRNKYLLITNRAGLNRCIASSFSVSKSK